MASARASLPAGETDFTPSMPAVFLPWFSWVTRRTATSRADRDFINNFCNLWTVFRSPRAEALKMRFCRRYRCCSSLRQGNAAHSSLGFASGALVSSMLLTLLHSTLSDLCQHILGITPGIGFSGHPTRHRHAVGTCSCHRPHMRVLCWLLRSDNPFCVAFRLLLSAGVRGSEYRSRMDMSAPILVHFWTKPRFGF